MYILVHILVAKYFLSNLKIVQFEIVPFPGIFAYLNYLTPKKRSEILELLVTGLKRLEYRGYDSAGLYFN